MLAAETVNLLDTETWFGVLAVAIVAVLLVEGARWLARHRRRCVCHAPHGANGHPHAAACPKSR